ncbi:hypothetical protein Ato02nite_014030 [Paractinoplanes toevensis]|uniref:Uncharacterized protein n=1 Tax=Paractinoplanes toevensis TaxID=571911 RepID=A0A919T5W1_9ACTN|nr:hypothetical protein [Actinoplanes toevensis]GIM89610.1 hypothetical protein Ato02nite_014030 [Actinoplanes toevensis]
MHGDPGRAADLARTQHIDAPALHRAGLVDTIVPDGEPGFVHRALAALASALAGTVPQPTRI